MVINELKHRYPITAILKVVGIPRSTYYYYTKQLEEPDKYADTKSEIKRIYDENHGCYGYRRITSALRKTMHYVNHKTVQRLMKQMGLYCRVRIQKYSSYKGEVGIIAPNLLDRQFKTDKPYTKWVTDVTQFSLFGVKIYLSPIIDLYNGEVISYNISHHPDFAQVTDMLEKAFRKIPDNTNLILHSDQGWLYQLKPYQQMLKAKGIRQSMSRKGNCLDNACAENFFGLLKSELLYLRDFSSVDEFILELDRYIEWYNNKRIKLKLDGLSPVQYRLKTA